jgi:MFS family permease
MSRDFRAYWVAEVTSTFGSMLTATTVGVVAVTIFEASAAEVGIVVAAGTLPALLLGLLSGVVADRVRRPRRLLIALDAIAATSVALLALGIWQGWASVAWLIAFNLLLGTVGVLIGPVYFTHLAVLVGGGDRAAQDDVVRARAKLQTGQYSARIAGRAAAGPIVAASTALGLLFDALSYLVSLVLLVSIRAQDRGASRPASAPGEPERRSVLAQINEGIRELRRQRFLLALITYLTVASLASGGIAALTAPFLLRVLQVPVPMFGLLYAVTGVAGLIGSLAATRLVSRVSHPALAVGGFAGSAATMLIFPMAGGDLPTIAAVAGLGAALPIFFGAIANVGLTGVMTTEVPDHLLGRVTATMTTGLTGAMLLGSVGGGLLGDAIGIRAALFACGAIAAAGLGLLLRTARQRTPMPVPVSPAPRDTVSTGSGRVEP